MNGWFDTLRANPSIQSTEPPGDSTNYPAVANWAALSTVDTPRRTGDRAPVTSIGPGNATGIAQWTGSEWALVYAIFNSVADLQAFAEPIIVGALAGVQDTGNDDETAVRYQYDGVGWARTAAGTPYVWTLTNLYTLDPSGIGVAVDGDYGTLNGRSYVLATIAVRAGAGGGTWRGWVLPEVASSPSPEVQGWFVGDETSFTLTARGNAITGTATTDGTDIILASSGAGGFNLLTQSTSVATADRYYIRGLYRANVSGSDAQAILARIGDAGASDYVATGQVAGGTLGFLTTLNTDAPDFGAGPGAALPSIASAPALIETVHRGMTVLTELWRDGSLVSVYRGDQQTSGADFVGAPFARSNFAGSACEIRSRFQVVIKW